MQYLRALEGWPGRGRGGQQLLAIAQHDLTVGADVDQQGDVIAVMGLLGDDGGYVVGADVAGFDRRHMDVRTGGHAQAQITGLDIQRVLDGRGKRSATQLHRVDTQKNVMHDGVAHHDHLHNIARRQSDFGRRVGHQPVERVDDRAAQRSQPVLVLHDIGDARHQVLAVGDLRVHAAGGGQDTATAQLGQMGGDGCRADVHRDAVQFLMVTGLQPDHLPVVPNSRGHRVQNLAFRGARPSGVQRRLHRRQNHRVDSQRSAVQVKARCQFVGQPRPVAPFVFHGRSGQFDIAEPHSRVDFEHPLAGCLAYHLFVSTALLRHGNQDIPQHQGGAALPAAGHQPLLKAIAGLAFRLRCHMVRGGLDAQTAEMARFDADLTLATGLLAATDRLDLYTKRARRVQQAGPFRHVTLPTGRLKYYAVQRTLSLEVTVALLNRGGGRCR